MPNWRALWFRRFTFCILRFIIGNLKWEFSVCCHFKPLFTIRRLFEMKISWHKTSDFSANRRKKMCKLKLLPSLTTKRATISKFIFFCVRTALDVSGFMEACIEFQTDQKYSNHAEFTSCSSAYAKQSFKIEADLTFDWKEDFHSRLMLTRVQWTHVRLAILLQRQKLHSSSRTSRWTENIMQNVVNKIIDKTN